ncbi:hypothetical protein HDU91_002923 [Kappamyces sp. JEL0680]|nr:hypothetical protein HDU91_002923 [Kappamyces sp. JEL0680]
MQGAACHDDAVWIPVSNVQRKNPAWRACVGADCLAAPRRFKALFLGCSERFGATGCPSGSGTEARLTQAAFADTERDNTIEEAVPLMNGHSSGIAPSATFVVPDGEEGVSATTRVLVDPDDIAYKTSRSSRSESAEPGLAIRALTLGLSNC